LPPVTIHDGVLVLTGYGLRVAVERGHLAVSDGVGSQRRSGLLARATCGLKRLVVLGHAGTVSLEALRWLHDVGAAFVQLGADGEVIGATGPVGLDDARLRRAQALAWGSDAGISLARSLLRDKLLGQRALLDRLPGGDVAAPAIDRYLERLDGASTVGQLRQLEGQAAAAYWGTWSAVPVRFATRDAGRVPAHWLTFGTRTSPLTGSPRAASNPANALLNYLYALEEIETRLACLTVGLDPGMGVLHADQKSRDSFALDLMEPLRPRIDALVLDLLERRVLAADDLFETRKGNCRLMPALAVPLAEGLPQLRRWVAPVVERAAATLMQGSAKGDAAVPVLPTPLTGANRSSGRDGVRARHASPKRPAVLDLPNACRTCGVLLEDGDRRHCDTCLPEVRAESGTALAASSQSVLMKLRDAGCDPGHGGDAAAKRAVVMRDQLWKNAAWDAASHPELVGMDFARDILPRIRDTPIRRLAETTGLSLIYCSRIRSGEKVPHPRHWSPLIRCRPANDESIHHAD